MSLPKGEGSAAGHIALRGVRVHNLKSIDLDIPHRKLIVLCGLSGSGKSSLALDTLYAEGQRRYIESFSAYTRQFLQRLEKPEAERIDGIPPAIAVTSKNTSRSSRSTVGTATETSDYLRLLLAKIGHVFCRKCGQEVRCDSPQNAAESLAELPPGTRYMIAFRCELPADGTIEQLAAGLREDGFVRAIVDGRLVNLDAGGMVDVGGRMAEEAVDNGQWTVDSSEPFASRCPSPASRCPSPEVYAIVDRLAAGSASDSRLRDSLETAFAKGRGRCYAFVEISDDAPLTTLPSPLSPHPSPHFLIDGRPWRRIGFSTQLACEDCGIEYPAPEPRLYSFNSPLGACPECEGFGNVIGIDMDLVVPDPAKSLREGAIAPWNTPAYAHELKELIALAARLRPSAGRAVSRAFRAASGADCARRAGAEVWRAGRLLRLAGAAEVQDAHPRVPEPLAEFSALSGVRRHAAAARGAGRADRRQEHRRDLRHEGPRRGRVLPQSRNCPIASGRSAG